MTQTEIFLRVTEGAINNYAGRTGENEDHPRKNRYIVTLDKCVPVLWFIVFHWKAVGKNSDNGSWE